MDLRTLWRAALLQLLAVAVIFTALALTIPKDFFVDWGWLVGPLAWLLCAGFTARVLGLPLNPTLLGALLAGLPSLVAVVVGAHEAGMVVALVLFALWCGRLAQHTGLPSAPSGRIE
ncbi:MAG TPA: hypothetical protein VGG40_11810 [Solirubrobacterales bacterium]|jgi:hypothetical protein